MKIIQIGDPILEQKAKKVEDVSSADVQEIIELLERDVRSDVESAGLAAPQIGKSISICTVKDIIPEEKAENYKTITLINPVIKDVSEKTSVYWEGCLSVGEGQNRLFGPVKRPDYVSIEYIDKFGKAKSLEARGYFSHIVQHEVDHLKGILFVKYIINPANIWKNKDLDKYIEENGVFPPVIGENSPVSDLIVD